MNMQRCDSVAVAIQIGHCVTIVISQCGEGILNFVILCFLFCLGGAFFGAPLIFSISERKQIILFS